MNVIAPARAPSAPQPTPGPEPLAADLLAAWPVAPGALLLLGRGSEPLPATGTAQYERKRSDRGPFRAACWKAGGAGGILFAAAVRLPSATDLRAGQTLTFQGLEGAAIRARLPADMATPLGFAADAARYAGGARSPRGAALVRFLSGSFPPAALQKLPAVGAMLTALLAELSDKDGCIELMGAVPGACGFLQGWGAPVRPAPGDGALDVFLVGTHLTCARARPAAFARTDIAAPAGGVVLVLADDVSADLEALERVYLVGETAVVRRDLVGRRVLTAADSIGHIRDLLPALQCPPDTADTLRRALRPRFEGHETLSSQKLPVRAAVDVALTVPDAGSLAGGAYVGGWLYDPADHVAEVRLRSTEGGPGARLDQHWTRVPRTDVTGAMSTSLFPAPSRDDHGFAVHVEAAGLVAPLYLDIDFRDGTCAFLPVRSQPADSATARARAFDGTDLHKPSGIAIVERHLGPLIRTLMRRAPPPVAADPGPPAGWALAVIVPLLGAPSLPRSFLSQFLRDGLGDDEGLVLVCGAAWSEGDIAGLQRLVGFMDLPARILRAPAATDTLAGLEAAAPVVPAAAWLLLADPGTGGGSLGWRAALRAAAAANPAAVACPTLLYEDLSIRYAGAAQLTGMPVAPYAAVHRPLAGMPAAMADDGPPRPATLGTLACCLVPRAALPVLNHARAGLATAFGQEVAAFLRLQAAGFTCLWVPKARVFAPETPAAVPGAVARLVDGWCLRAAHAAGDFAAPHAGRAEA